MQCRNVTPHHRRLRRAAAPFQRIPVTSRMHMHAQYVRVYLLGVDTAP